MHATEFMVKQEEKKGKSALLLWGFSFLFCLLVTVKREGTWYEFSMYVFGKSQQQKEKSCVWCLTWEGKKGLDYQTAAASTAETAYGFW